MIRTLTEPPMDLGQTLKGTDADLNLINSHYLGQVCYFDNKAARSDKNRQTGKPIGAILLRNTSGLTLLGKRFGQLDRTAGFGMVHNVDGYSTTLNNMGVVLIDPYLPSSGVADDDIFWGLFSGPALVLLPLVGSDHTADIAVNDPLVAATGTTTGATTSGRVTHVRFVNATDGSTINGYQTFRAINGCVGRAMTLARRRKRPPVQTSWWTSPSRCMPRRKQLARDRADRVRRCAQRNSALTRQGSSP